MLTPSTTTTAWRATIVGLLIGFLSIPAYVFFHQRGGLTFLSGHDGRTTALLIFPLFGLYALTLVWLQVMLGSLMPLWRKLFPNIFYYHRWQGSFALLFALTHPTLLAFGVGIDHYLKRDFIASSKVPFIFFGYTALFCILLTVISALAMKTKLGRRFWRTIHYLNYLVFVSAWIHSYNLGSDIQSTGLRYVWMWYGGSVVVAFILRLTTARRKTVSAPISPTPLQPE
jgi:DMSO/TMAO reductase YedYZ heme-binding membrane subunit